MSASTHAGDRTTNHTLGALLFSLRAAALSMLRFGDSHLLEELGAVAIASGAGGAGLAAATTTQKFSLEYDAEECRE